MTLRLSFRSNMLVTCSVTALAIGASASAARADTFESAYTYSLGGGAPTTLDTGVSTVPTDIYINQSDESGDNAFGHDYSYSTGIFGSRSSGTNNFSISGLSVYSTTFTAAANGEYFFNYTITSGELGVSLGSGANGSQSAGLSAVIQETLGTAAPKTLLDYVASMNVSDPSATPTFSETGGVLNVNGPTLAAGYGDYQWDNITNAADLGFLTAGQTVTVTYTLNSNATGTTTTTASCDVFTTEAIGYGGYGGYGGGPTVCDTGSAVGRIGDPSTVSNNPVVPFSVTVPEPASAAVLGAGLAGLAFMRRRKTA